jgi:DnaJ-class molecular chaperone
VETSFCAGRKFLPFRPIAQQQETDHAPAFAVTMDGPYSSRQCPYDTLGVDKTASHDEIKAAFRKLSKETHPDVAKKTAAGASDPASAADRFKQISHAASILTNPKRRQLYDESTKRMFPGSPYANMRGRPSSSSSSSHHYKRSAMESLLRPRNFILGPMALFATVSAVQYVIGSSSSDNSAGHQKNGEPTALVQAWLNPETKRYETPAPWCPVYRHVKPELEYVPRDQVYRRSR